MSEPPELSVYHHSTSITGESLASCHVQNRALVKLATGTAVNVCSRDEPPGSAAENVPSCAVPSMANLPFGSLVQPVMSPISKAGFTSTGLQRFDMHTFEHASLSTMFPSSHCSPVCWMPSPQNSFLHAALQPSSSLVLASSHSSPGSK